MEGEEGEGEGRMGGREGGLKGKWREGWREEREVEWCFHLHDAVKPATTDSHCQR